MGGRIRYTEEFKLGAVAQVTDTASHRLPGGSASAPSPFMIGSSDMAINPTSQLALRSTMRLNGLKQSCAVSRKSVIS